MVGWGGVRRHAPRLALLASPVCVPACACLQERTRRKIVILGSDYLPTLLQLIPEDKCVLAWFARACCLPRSACLHMHPQLPALGSPDL